MLFADQGKGDKRDPDADEGGILDKEGDDGILRLLKSAGQDKSHKAACLHQCERKQQVAR